MGRARTEAEIRAAKNKDLVERMRRGESLALIDNTATWWPDRTGNTPKKDPDMVRRLYGEDTTENRGE